MKTRVINEIKRDFPELFQGKCLVAVSGGVDSMVLLRVLVVDADVECAVAHVNYMLRGEDSMKDRLLVKQVCRELEVPFHETTIDLKKKLQQEGGSLQEVARDVRYAFFDELLEGKEYDFLVTGHQQDDQVETIYQRLIRNAGVDGMAGIPVRRGPIVRPLLGFSRQELTSLAEEEGWVWREDKSNESLDYERNRIRHEILPRLETQSPGFRKELLELGRMSRLLSLELQENYAEFRDAKIEVIDGVERVRLEDVINSYSPDDVLFRWLAPRGFTSGTIRAIGENLNRSSGRHFSGRDGDVYFDRGTLIFHRPEEVEVDVMVDEGDFVVRTPFGRLEFQSTGFPEKFEDHPNAIYVDEECLEYPLHLTSWQEGDAMRPLGMKGTKKVSDILIDRKVPVPMKEKTLVLRSGEEILWVVGVKQGHKQRITSKTSHVLRIEFFSDHV